MIKIGNEKLFTVTELLENLREYLKTETAAAVTGDEYDLCRIGDN